MESLTQFITDNYFFVTLVLFTFGACIGSFLNVCIHRLPQEGMSIVKPGSHCPSCKKALHWYDNIPIISFVNLRGKCRFCGVAISPRYVIIEVITAYIFVQFFNIFGLTPQYFLYVYLMCSLLVATAVDFQYQIIPDEVNYAGVVVGLLASFLFPTLHGESTRLMGLAFGALGLLSGAGAIFLTGCLGNLVFRRESMGGGDVKLMAMIGVILGWKLTLLTFFIAPFFGSVVGLYVKYVRKEDIIPYGPFLSLAAVVSLFCGEKIIRLVLG
jgi:leader peptidase (prepilin peptidase) / N-methyltransferase